MFSRLSSILILSSIALSGVVHAGLTPQFGDIARHADGSVNYMNQEDAVKYCSEIKGEGAHLPSIRELAQLASQVCTPETLGVEPCGAAGIKEINQYPRESATYKDGYYVVTPLNEKSFYFSDAGYKRPSGDLGDNKFWSSTVFPDHYFPDHPDLGYVLSGVYGGVYYGNYRYYDDYAVRCVAGR